ncbi:hypothetical protein OSTOST_25339, partial [Ostertagia ostertagi]
SFEAGIPLWRGIRVQASTDGTRSTVISYFQYSLLHIAPPCSTPPAVRECRELTDEKGWVDVDPKTLRSKHFPNVFAAGDCMNTGNAKTAAAVSSHLKTVEKNLTAVLEGREPPAKYDGYCSCPLVISKDRGYPC